jgi:hypothetical protein
MATRLRKLFGVPRYREMRLSDYIIRQRIGSNIIEVTLPEGTKVEITGKLTSGNVREIILSIAEPSLDASPTLAEVNARRPGGK